MVKAKGFWLGLIMGLTILVSIGADGAKPKSTGKAKGDLPEVIRNDENDDVDGKPGKIARPKTAPTLRPSDLDALIAKGLAVSGTAPSGPTKDEEFIRRVYLDTLGQLPTPGAIRQFAQSKLANKRAMLIDALLSHPEYAKNWARYWRDVIQYRSPNENDRQVDWPVFTRWLTEQLDANKHWDKIATEIITATGQTDENGATIFSIAEESQPVEIAGEVSRVFLGIQIQCAQCHDHPSDPWKREQFHEFAAFFSGQKRKNVAKAAGGQKAIFNVMAEGVTHYSMPDLKNPEKKIAVSPRFFLGSPPKVSESVHAESRLALAAQYVTGDDNPWFAKAFINRIWYSLMGEGFYTPIDDLGPNRTANSPEVLEVLADNWQRSGYDIEWLFRTILNTQAYQRESQSTNSAAGRTPFASNVPSRLRGDQIYEALEHALNLDREKVFPGKPGKAAMAKGVAAKKGAAPDKKIMQQTKAQMADMARDPDDNKNRADVNHAFGVDPSMPSNDVVGTIPQALYMMNGPLITKNVQARPGTMLGELLTTFGDNRTAIDVLFLKAFGRHPNAKELATSLHYVNTSSTRGEAFEDLLWSLVNSTEFISRR